MDESEKRRERLKAMRMEAAQSGDVGATFAMTTPHCLANPLIENTTVRPRLGTPRFDYYTNPGSAFSADRRQNQTSLLTPQQQQQYRTPPSSNYIMHQQQQQFRTPPPSNYITHHLQQQYRTPPTSNYVTHLQQQQHCTPPPRQRNPELILPSAYEPEASYSTNQIMHQAQGPYSSPDLYGSPIRMASPFHNKQETPAYWNRSNCLSNYHSSSATFDKSIFSSPGSSSISNARVTEPQFNNSPVFEGIPAPYPGRGRGRSSGCSSKHGSGRSYGRHARFYEDETAEFRPYLYFDKSMLEDPWKILKPIAWRENMSGNTSYPVSPNHWLPSSIRPKRARVSEATSQSTSQPSLAEYLAASFNEAVNKEVVGEKHHE